MRHLKGNWLLWPKLIPCSRRVLFVLGHLPCSDAPGAKHKPRQGTPQSVGNKTIRSISQSDKSADAGHGASTRGKTSRPPQRPHPHKQNKAVLPKSWSGARRRSPLPPASTARDCADTSSTASASSQFARVAKGVDLRSTGGNSAWARTPQLTPCQAWESMAREETAELEKAAMPPPLPADSRAPLLDIHHQLWSCKSIKGFARI